MSASCRHRSVDAQINATPDGIHPRVLFELRYELLEPLNILSESSYKLGKLQDEWKLGHVTAVYKKGPNILPCGIPLNTLKHDDFSPFKTIAVAKLLDLLPSMHGCAPNSIKNWVGTTEKWGH